MANLIWVDKNNNIIGYGEKLYTHQIGMLHRAFSLFLYDPNIKSLLLQKRSRSKYHSGGLWSNACCSHFIDNDKRIVQQIIDTICRELGYNPTFREIKRAVKIEISLPSSEFLFELGKFQYFCQYDGLAENEIDTVYLNITSSKAIIFSPNIEEVEDLQWRKLDFVVSDVKEHPEKYTSWFPMALDLVMKYIDDASMVKI